MTTNILVLIERLRAEHQLATRGLEIVGEIVPCNLATQAADILSSYHSLAQDMGFSDVGEALVKPARLITTWRKTGAKVLEWDHHVSETAEEAERVVENIKKQGVHQFHTFKLGAQLPALSSEY